MMATNSYRALSVLLLAAFLVAICGCESNGCGGRKDRGGSTDRTSCVASCGMTQDSCQERCGESVECHQGCQKGYQTCVQACGKDDEGASRGKPD